MTKQAFQDRIPNLHCFGCGPENAAGLRIKSTWSGKGESVCRFRPEPHHSAGPRHVVNGGVIATVMDCHAICTAVADGYQRAGLAIGEGDEILYVTGSLSVTYLEPAPIDACLEFRATVSTFEERKTRLTCTVAADGTPVAKGEVVAVRVSDWAVKGR